jgi:hypothetical protein
MATPVQQVLGVCGAVAAEIQTLEIQERLDTIQDFAEMTSRDVTELAKELSRRNANAGRLIMPHKLIKNIKGLCFWALERTRTDQPLEAALFTAAALTEAKLQLAIREETTDSAPTIHMEKFKPTDWTQWSRDFQIYLSNHSGISHAPLDYVIRAHPPEAGTPSARELDLQRYPLTGIHYKEDNMRIYRILNPLITGSEAMTWTSAFERAQDGRGAWLAMVNHYEGGGQQEKRTSRAEAILTNLHYKNESSFSFEAFSTKLMDAFRDLNKGGIVKTPREQIKLLLSMVQVNCTSLDVLKAHVKHHFPTDLPGAIGYLSTEFAELFPDETFGLGRKRRYVNETNTGRSYQRTGGRGGRGRGGGGRGHGRGDGSYGGRSEASYGGRGENGIAADVQEHNGVYTLYGVDVTTCNRTFSPQEMTNLGGRGQRYIFDQRRLQGQGNERVIAATGTSHQNGGDDISAITQTTAGTGTNLPPPPTGISPPTSAQGDQRGSQNGSRFGSGHPQYSQPRH